MRKPAPRTARISSTSGKKNAIEPMAMEAAMTPAVETGVEEAGLIM